MGGENLDKDLKKKKRALKISYKKRKRSLFKKGFELATLCGIDLCIIIIDPEQGNKKVKLETWPADPQQVKYVIRKYLAKQPERRSFLPASENAGNTDLRKKLRVAKYPVWDDRINNYSEDELRKLLRRLDAKLKITDEKINMMEGTPLVMLKDASRVGNDLELELFPRTRNLIASLQGYQQQNSSNASSSGQQSVSDIYPYNDFQDGFQASYPQVIPFNPYIWGTWPQAMLNDTRNSTDSGIAPSTQFPQLNEQFCLDPVPWNWQNSMFKNAIPRVIHGGDSSMQPMPQFSQFPVMFSVPSQMISYRTQTTEAIDFFQQNNNNNAKS